MGRLYYETDASLPKSKGEITNQGGTKPATQPNPGKTLGDYLDKVSRLVPSELIAGHLFMSSLIVTIKDTNLQVWGSWIIFIVCLVLTPLYLNNVADADKPKRNHLIVSTLAFIVWAYVTTGNQLTTITFGAPYYDQALASIILVLFSLISAVIPLNK